MSRPEGRTTLWPFRFSPGLNDRSVRAGLLAAALLALPSIGCARRAEPAGVDLACADCSLVVVSIDTLRADHLSCYGYSRPTSPAIDRFASRSLLFEKAYAPSYHTADSHMSIFTGTYPSVHRVRNIATHRAQNRLPATIRTLPEALAEADFVNAGFHGGGNVSAPYGFGRGFASYTSTLDDLGPAVQWLKSRAWRPAQRFFLFAHTYRTHDPYLPSPPYDKLWLPEYEGPVFSDQASFAAALHSDKFDEKRTLFWSRVDPGRPDDVAKVVALYDGEIRQVDDELAPLLEELESLDERVMVVLISDHGEEFHEHGGWLHDNVFEETLRVPLIIRHPDGRGGGERVPWRVSLVDLAPTLLDALAVPPLPTAQGRSWRAALRGDEPAKERPIVAEKLTGDRDDVTTASSLKQALLFGDLKLISPPQRTPLLFDLGADPLERVDLRESRPEEHSRLVALLGRLNDRNLKLWGSIPRSDVPIELDRETLERLRALGYL